MSVGAPTIGLKAAALCCLAAYAGVHPGGHRVSLRSARLFATSRREVIVVRIGEGTDPDVRARHVAIDLAHFLERRLPD